MLDSAMAMLLAREEAFKPDGPPDKRAVARAARLQRAWHWAFERSRDNPLCQRCIDTGLTPQEREILAGLLLVQLGMIGTTTGAIGEVISGNCLRGRAALEALHSVSEYGSLVRHGFVKCTTPYVDPGAQVMCVDPAILDAVLHEGCPDAPGWPVKTEEEFRNRLEGMALLLSRKSSMLRSCKDYTYGYQDAQLVCRKAALEMTHAQMALARNPEWRIARVLAPLGAAERTIIFALLSKELGFVARGNDLFNGEGLGMAITDQPHEVLAAVPRFVRLATTTLRDYIQPCGGIGSTPGYVMANAEETEFEIKKAHLDAMQICRQLDEAANRLSRSNQHDLGPRDGGAEVRKPNTELTHVVLSARTREAIEMAVAHARNADKLVTDWGLGKVIPYGRGVTLLFCGPPGTGKTATAEALAHALKKQIVQVDYAQVQSCYPGVTERAITAIFNAARKSQAVMFWDEADAMLGTREMAHRHWEVRETNVLLQEIERFEGICILATNRKFALDAALERRITLKVEFDRPDRSMRREIWKRLLPQKLPLAPDVDLDQLSASDLTGGEIKNVVLNAARLALRRDGQGPVTLVDFGKALVMEREGRWSEGTGGKIGFGT
jgi:SpoVK/Ycf46/Vps4 family AAA+-type ATPase